MNFSKLVLSFHVLILLLTASCEAEGRGAVKGPLIWDMSNFEKLKTDTSYSRLYKSIIKESNNICEMPPVTVMDKVKTFAPDKHYFCSIGTYWWPDPNNPGQYINKDGKTNPECNLYDRASLSIMSKRCQNLCVAYYLTKDEKYYDAFIRQIKAWFIDEETYMYPNFEYAQVIPGRNENKGRSTGYIGAYPFNSVLESIRLTNAIKEIDSQTLKSLKKWFLKFAEWSDHGVYSTKLHEGLQNISIAYDVTLIDMYLFVGKEKRARRIADEFARKRLEVQIAEDGSQPGELIRTKAFTYSLFNLSHLLDFCYLVRYFDKDYFANYGQPVEKAFGYLTKFVGKNDAFPYKQISSWEESENDYYRLKRRLYKLKGVKSIDTVRSDRIKLDDIVQ